MLAGGLITWLVLDDSPYDAAPPGASGPRPSPALATAALRELDRALDTGDIEAAAALAPPGDEEAADLLADVASGAGSLGLDLDLRYVDETGGLADGTWAAAVETTWRFADDVGADPASSEVTFEFQVVDEERVGIVGIGEPDRGRLPLWLSGPVVVASRPDALVVVAGEGPSARDAAARYLRLAEAGIDVVRRVLPRWRGPLVVEVPSSDAALDRALDADPGSSTGIAAVTAPVDGSPDTDSPVHVFVNPDVFDRLRPTGARVVISHEVAHVATEAARSTAEPWLVEGFADYVALRNVRLPVTTSAAQIIRQVRREGVPRALPSAADFAAGSGHLGATYESAWLVCMVLAERGGEQALVRLYQDVSGGTEIAKALREHFGLGERQLTRLWQRRLEDLAG